MTVNNNTTYLNNSGAVSFRSIQSHFANGNSNVIKMGDYTRNTDENLTPSQITANNGGCVPHATENSDVNTSKSDMKMSDYHGTIREYRMTMTGCEEMWKIQNESWNSNLDKNVFCHMTVNGTSWSHESNTNQQTGGTDAGGALVVNDGLNIELDVQWTKGFYGSFGPGGTGGDKSNSTAPTDGVRGGDALYLQCNGNRGTNEVTVRIQNGGRIYGGGGGGGGGGYGNDGSIINCWVDHYEPMRANAAVAPTHDGGGTHNAAAGSKYFRNIYSNINGQNAVGNGNWRNRASDNPSRACANSLGSCPNNWIWYAGGNLGGSGWVNSLISNANGAISGSGLDTNVTPATGGHLNNCREWGYSGANSNAYSNPNTPLANNTPNTGDSGSATNQRGRCRGRGERGASYGNASSCTKEWVRRCYYKFVYELGKGIGGDGGDGGNGEGRGSCNHWNTATSGANGDSGNTVTCNANSPANNSVGTSGGDGGNGSNWGVAGNAGGNGSVSGGSGGAAGYAIYRNSGGASWNITGGGANNGIKGPTGSR